MASQPQQARDTTTAYYDSAIPGDYMVWQSAVQCPPDGVRKRLALALSGFCAVAQRVESTGASQAVAAWWDMRGRQRLGNHRTLLEWRDLSSPWLHQHPWHLKEDVG
jgi:uncharacterized protein (DUF1800 family)